MGIDSTLAGADAVGYDLDEPLARATDHRPETPDELDAEPGWPEE